MYKTIKNLQIIVKLSDAVICGLRRFILGDKQGFQVVSVGPSVATMSTNSLTDKCDSTVKEWTSDMTGKESIHENHAKENIPDNTVKEGKAEVFSPPHVFYNPVQEFNRDLTIAVISEFSKERWTKSAVSKVAASNGQEVHDQNHIDAAEVTKTSQMTSGDMSEITSSDMSVTAEGDVSQLERGKYEANGIRVLEGLAATGLRSIRFALELPGVKEIVCNDFDKTAFTYIQKNCAHNNVEHLVTPSYADAATVMYQNKRRPDRFDVIDLDPYGSPVMFLDSAVQAVRDGGLLCVTCTDMGVLCGNASETCYSKYGAVSLRTKYCHEMAVRIVLRAIDSHANRYSRYIVPVLSLSIDFYVRVFVKVYFGQSKVKQSLSKTSLVYHCSGCGSFKLQPMGLCTKTKDGGVKYSPAAGPTVSPHCVHCGFTQHLAGPIWSDPIHNVEFVERVISSVEKEPGRFKTAARIMGMLTVATEELPHVPLYYITDDLCRIVHCTAPRFIQMRSALLHAGYHVSMSHAQPNSLKTDAPNHVLWDIIRCWTKENPVSKKRLKEGTPAHVILTKEPEISANFSLHPDANPKSREKGLLRWQANPERDWGPMPRAKLGEMKTLEERRQEGIDKSRKRKEKRKAQQEDNDAGKKCKADDVGDG